jgi:hypothetical protein
VLFDRAQAVTHTEIVATKGIQGRLLSDPLFVVVYKIDRLPAEACGDQLLLQEAWEKSLIRETD